MRIRIPTWLLLRIAERDKWTCHICEQGYIPGQPWVIDHDQALAKGGTNHVKNLRLAHKRCNLDKAAA
jgi:hypothetical protein